MLGKIEGRRRRGWQKMRQLDSITDSIDVYLNKLQETVKDRGAWHVAVCGGHKELDLVTEKKPPPNEKTDQKCSRIL